MKRRVRFVIAGALVFAAVAAITPGTMSRFTATITNSGTTASTNAYFQCASMLAPGVDGGGALFVWPLTETSGTIAADTSGHANTGAYVTSPTADTTTTPAKACPRDTGAAWALDGATSAAYLGNMQANPTTFTLETWFATSQPSGKLIGFGSAKTGASGSYDRHLYVNTAGRLVFGIYNSATYTVASPTAVTDGVWHHAVATLAPTGTLAGMRLYLDGALVANDTAHVTPQNYSGYWRIGYDNQNGWPSVGTTAFFKGSLRYAAVYPSVLTPTQVRQHFGAGTGS